MNANNRTFTLIWITLFVEMLGVGIIIPVMPDLLNEVADLNASEAAPWGGALMAVFAVMQFFMSPVLGNLSDRFGRRPVIMFSLIGYAADFVLMALAPALWILFVARALSGAFAATYATSSAAVADITPPEQKAARFGMLGAAFGLGFIAGPAIGGQLGSMDGFLGLSSARLPFLGAAVLAAVNAVFVYLMLPETLPEEKRRPFRLARANPVGGLMQMTRYPIAVVLLSSFFVMQLAHSSLPAIWAYFANEQFAWGPREIGYTLAFVGLIYAIFQGGLTGPAIKSLGEMRAITLGLLATALAMVGYSLAQEGWMMFPAIVIGAAGAFIMPAIQSVLSSTLPDDAQCELQGAIAAIMALTMIIGPVVFTTMFRTFTHNDAATYWPGAPFMVAAILTAVAAFIVLPTVRQVKVAEAQDPQD